MQKLNVKIKATEKKLKLLEHKFEEAKKQVGSRFVKPKELSKELDQLHHEIGNLKQALVWLKESK